MRTFTELSSISDFHERYEYLRLGGIVGEETFGYDRILNQRFYHSTEWKHIRRHVIARDMGFDLGHGDFPIQGKNALIHHMNPLRPRDFDDDPESMLDPEFLISTSLRTHNAIHYSDESQLPRVFVERRPGDTRLW